MQSLGGILIDLQFAPQTTVHCLDRERVVIMKIYTNHRAAEITVPTLIWGFLFQEGSTNYSTSAQGVTFPGAPPVNHFFV